MEENIRIQATIRGRVQGVCFRMETRDAANQHGVTGWVRNKADGTVEAVFEGSRQRVQAVLDWCRQGPPLSRVEDVVVKNETFAGEFTGFDIRY